MPVDEYKALTRIHLPFIEEDYEPGSMIPRSSFDESADRAAALIDDRSAKDEDASPVLTADEQIDYFIEWGSLSEDPDAPLHPDHIIPDPNVLSMVSLVNSAQRLVAELEERGEEVPAKLRDLADISDRQIAAVEHGRVVDSVVEE